MRRAARWRRLEAMAHAVPQTPAGTPDVVAVTGHEPSHAGAHPQLLGLDAEQWVYVGLLIFLLLAIFVAKAPKKVAAMLDARIAETRRELDEARAIRAEAERLLADAQARQAASATDAERIVAQAQTESQAMLAKAETDAASLIERRTRMAEDKIAAAERAAVDEVRARVATAATAAAEQLIRDRLDDRADRQLVEQTIQGLGRAH
jgi:F-type H+-transporting ATPase subunit b